MKRIAAVLVIVAFALAFVGCGGCPRTNDTTGVTTKTMFNCVDNAVGKAQAMVCNPPQSVLTVVTAAIAIFSTMTSSPAAFDMAVCKSIQTVGCTDLTALQTLINDLNTFNQTAGAGVMVPAAKIDPQPLVDWSHTAH